RDINTNTGANTDNVVVADANGVLKTVAVSDVGSTSEVTQTVTTGNTIATHDDGQGNTVDIIETVTTFDDTDGDGVYTYASEDGTITDIDTNTTASNGLNIDGTSGDVKLGGDLIEDTVINQDSFSLEIATNEEDLIISGLDKSEVQATVNGATTTGITQHLLAVDENNNVKALKAAMPKFFYMPSIIVPTSEEQLNNPASGQVTGDAFDDNTLQGTINLYGRYEAQFGT